MKRPARRRLLRVGAVLGSGLLLGATAGRGSRAADEGKNGGEDGEASVLGRPRPGSLWVIHGDGSDTTELWEEALAGLAAAGGGSLRATGEHLISRALALPDVARLDIAGDGAALLRKADAGREFRIFTAAPPMTPRASLVVRDLHFLGDWDAAPSMGGDGARCIAVRGYHRVVLRDLSAAAFRNMTFTADDCDEVRIEGCRIDRSARDPINLTGSRLVKVTGCSILNAWDDAIAVHVPRDVTDDARRWATLIAHNQILQANGIKVLGGRDISILGNQVLAPNNYGIYLGHDPHWREGGVPHRNLIIADNIVSEMLAPEYLPGHGRIGCGIFCVDPGRPVLGARITGNVVTKYKPSGRGVRFSHWGFGATPAERRLFTADGWIDPELVHGHQGKGFGVRVIAANAQDERAIAIENNSFANLGHDIDRRVEG